MKPSASSQAAARYARFLLTALVVPVSVIHAGFIKQWQLRELSQAPVLVVGRVVMVHKGEVVPAGSLPWKAETLAMTADVQVLRSFTTAGQPQEGDQLRVRFLQYGPSVTQFVNGYPPPLPGLEPGHVYVLPLQEHSSKPDEPWQLIADFGMDLIIPVHGEYSGPNTPLSGPRQFLVREIANTLSIAPPPEVAVLAVYLRSQDEDLSGEVVPLLEGRIVSDQQRWAEVASNLVAAQGIPRPTIAELTEAPALPGKWTNRKSLFLVDAAVRKMSASPPRETVLIRLWIDEAPLHAWGSAMSLVEFAATPLTTDLLRSALQNDVEGSSFIASTLMRNGNQSILAPALQRALKVVDRPGTLDYEDLGGAAALLRDYGSEEQLKQLAAIVKKYQTLDKQYYGVLWQSATEAGNPREARVLFVVLQDRRTMFRDIRYCDAALGALERATGEHFGAGAKSIAERDAAISRALVWLRSKGLTN